MVTEIVQVRSRARSETRGATRSRRRRVVIQALSLAAFLGAFVLAAAGRTDLPVEGFFLADPLLVATSALAAGEVALAAVLAAGALLAATALFGRFFCGYLCPLGTCLDWTSGHRKRRPEGEPTRGRWVKQALLAALLVAALAGLPWAHFLDPLTLLWHGLAFAVYPGLLAVGGAALDGVRGALDAVSSTTPLAFSLPRRVFLGGGLSLALLAAVFATQLAAPRFWCRHLCPLGALLGLVGRRPWLVRRVDAATCVDCTRCRAACPMAALASGSAPPRSGECLLCLRCSEACPRSAVRLELRPPWRTGREAAGVAPTVLPSRSRRLVLGAAACGFAGAVGRRWSPWRRPARSTPLRPPGSLPEDEFLARCMRCGVCMQTCPTNVIQPDLWPARADGLYAPKLVLRRGGCDPACNRCGLGCPTGAIRPLALEERRRAVIGTAVVDRRRCLRAAGRDCRACLEVCPYGALELRREEGGLWPAVLADRCTGCGLCEFRCPSATEGDDPWRARPAVAVVGRGEAPAWAAASPQTLDEGHLPLFLQSP